MSIEIPEDLSAIDRLVECLKASNSGVGRMNRARELAQECKDEEYRRSWRGRWEKFKWADRGKR